MQIQQPNSTTANDYQDSPMSVGSPGAPRVVGIARVGGLCIHGDAALQRLLGSGQHRACSTQPPANAAEPRVRSCRATGDRLDRSGR